MNCVGRFAPFVVICVGFVLAIPGRAAGEKKPLPSAEAQTKARELIRDVYGEDVAAAKNAQAKAKVAQALLDSALALEDDLAGQYVLLHTANNMAVGAGEVDLALRILHAIDAGFVVDHLSLQIKAVARLGKTVHKDGPRKALATVVTDLVPEATAVDRYDDVAAMVKVGLKIARRLRDRKLIARLGQIEKTNAARRADFGNVKKALVTLETTPDDAAANATVGRFRCFLQDRWQEGVPFLAMSDDASLKALAIQELGAGNSVNEQSALGDAWWEFAEKPENPDSDSARRRAVYWYEHALKGMTGLTAKRIEKRIAKVPEEDRVRAQPGEVVARKIPMEIAIACRDRHAVVLWDFKAGDEAMRSLDFGKAMPSHLAVSPDGRRLAVNVTVALTLWDVESGKMITNPRHAAAPAPIGAVVFSPDGARIATGGQGSTLCFWDGHTGKRLQVFDGDGRYTSSIAFSADGLRLFQATGKTSPIWDVKTGRIVGRLSGRRAYSVSVCPDGQKIVSQTMNDGICLFDAKSGRAGKAVRTHGKVITDIAVSPDSKQFITGHSGPVVRVWNVAEPPRVIKKLKGHAEEVVAVAYGPTGAHCVSVDETGLVIVWDAKTWKKITSINVGVKDADVVFVGGS